MAGSIKGITIEIGGNTAPLQKAMRDVNSTSASLKTELREVERLLKLDPTNTTLLAQKQELLGKQVETTSEKLQRLKSVQDQIDRQYASGEIDDGQYRAFQRELAKTEAEMKKVESQADDTGDEVKKAGDKAEQSGKDAEKGKSKWESFGGALKGIAGVAGKAVAAIGASVVAAGGAFLGLAESTREARTNMGKLETSFTTAGHSAEAAKSTYTELYGVLGDDGQATEAAAHLAKLANSEKDLSDWTKIATGVYATFGDSLPIEGLTEAANETAKTGALTGSLADALNWAGVSEDDFQKSLDGCSTEQERQALITETLNGLYSEAADKYKEVNGEIIESQKATAKLNEVIAELGAIAEPIVTELKKLVAGLLEDILPFVSQIGEGLTGLANGAEGAAGKLADGFMGLAGFLLEETLKLLPAFADMVVEIVATVAEGIINAAPTLIPAIIETVAQVIQTVVTELANAAPTLIPAIVEIVTTTAMSLLEQLPILLEALLQLVEGIAIGLLDALPIIIEKLPEIIQGIIDALVTFIPQLIECGIKLFVALVENLPEIIQGIVDALPQIIDAIVNGIVELIPQIVACGVKLLTAIIQNLPQIIVTIGRAIPQIVSSIVNGFINLFSQIGEVGRQLFSQLISNGGAIMSEIGSFVSELMGSLIETITGWFSSFGDIGYNIVTGIWNGISSGWSWLTGQVSSLAHGLLDAAKNALGIHSPSTKFRDEIGKMMAAGIGEGFDMESVRTFGKIKSKLKTEEKKLAAGIVNNSTSTVNNSTSLGGIVVNLNGNIGNVADARQIGDTVAERVQRGLRYKGVLSLA